MVVLCAIIFSQEEEYQRLIQSMIYYSSNHANCSEYQFMIQELHVDPRFMMGRTMLIVAIHYAVSNHIFTFKTVSVLVSRADAILDLFPPHHYASYALHKLVLHMVLLLQLFGCATDPMQSQFNSTNSHATSLDAINKCSVPCPNGNECPEGERCFDKTPCDSDISSTQPFYCGFGPSEAKSKCWQPCPSQQDSECCFGQTCNNTGGTCLISIDTTDNNRFCGTDSCDAGQKCAQVCPGGTDEECPELESCFDNTPCSSNGPDPPEFENQYCGQDEADAAANCWQPCNSNSDCCFAQQCYGVADICGNPNFQGSPHFFCGTGESN